MFARVSSLSVVALASLLAVVTAAPQSLPASQCNTSDLQCCTSTESSTDSLVSELLGLLGISAGDIGALVGLTCSPLTIIGGGGSSCTAQPVCCTNNSFSGLIAVGCTPVNVSL